MSWTILALQVTQMAQINDIEDTMVRIASFVLSGRSYLYRKC